MDIGDNKLLMRKWMKERKIEGKVEVERKNQIIRTDTSLGWEALVTVINVPFFRGTISNNGNWIRHSARSQLPVVVSKL